MSRRKKTLATYVSITLWRRDHNFALQIHQRNETATRLTKAASRSADCSFIPSIALAKSLALKNTFSCRRRVPVWVVAGLWECTAFQKHLCIKSSFIVYVQHRACSLTLRMLFTDPFLVTRTMGFKSSAFMLLDYHHQAIYYVTTWLDCHFKSVRTAACSSESLFLLESHGCCCVPSPVAGCASSMFVFAKAKAHIFLFYENSSERFLPCLCMKALFQQLGERFWALDAICKFE